MGHFWTFGRKLAGGFAVLILLVLAMLVLFYRGLDRVVAVEERIMERNAASLVDAERIASAVEKRAASIRGYILTHDNKFLTRASEADEAFARAARAIRGRDVDRGDARDLEGLEAAWADYRKECDDALAVGRTQPNSTELASIFDGRVLPKFEAVNSRVRTFTERQQTSLETGQLEARHEAKSVTWAITGGCGLLTALALLVAVLLTRTLTRQIGGSVMTIRSASAELQSAASQQASGAKEHATAMKEITTTIGELLITARQIADGAQRVARIAGDTADGARAGERFVVAGQDAEGAIRKHMDTIVQHMLDLGRKSQQIGGILELITELADQTNILAINATIEAAGAGENGRRFAVVGEEIRKLADRVGASTKEIRALVDEIRSAVNTTVMATEAGSKSVEAGTQRFVELTTGFRRIAELVLRTTEASREIELSTTQQTTAVEQVNAAIANVAQATREAEAGASQTLQTAGQLTSLSDGLARLI